MKRICILALIGLPAAGKTTFCRWLLSLAQQDFSIIHLCYDDFFKNSCVETNVSNELAEFDFRLQRLEILKILEKIVLALNETKTLPKELQAKIKIRNVERNDFLIICDDNNYYRSMRYKLHQFCKNHSLAYAQIYFDCSLTMSLARNAHRIVEFERIPQDVLIRMAARLEAPTAQTLAWEANTITLNTAANIQFDEASVMHFIIEAFKNVVAPNEEELKQNSAIDALQPSTEIHQLDVLLRRRIKQLLDAECNDGAQKQSKAMMLNRKRKQILQKFKENKQDIVESANLIEYVNMLK